MYINDSTNSDKKPFDIRNFTDKLTHVNGEKYICPVCGGNNLSISNKSGAYKCWNGCQVEDIREAVSPRENNTKPVRPAANISYFYNDRHGKRLVKITRIDDGKGHKEFPQSAWNGKVWQSNLKGLDRSKIPCYRYQEVRQAIAQGNPIFVTEGEGKADALWQIGIAATTFMGGSGNYRNYGNYQQDLEGAKLVLCPDRDLPGLKYMEEISEDYPDSQWLYAPPSDFFWSHLPQNRGLDIKDWIAGGATAAQILEAVGKKKDLKVVASTSTTSAKVVTHPSFAQPNIKEIGGDIDKLISQDLRRSQLLIAFSELAQKYKMAENAISKIYYTRIEELDKEDARGDVKAEIEALLAAQRSSLNLSEILPVKLAAPIEKLASILNLKPECFLIALLTQASAMFKVGTETMLFPQSKYRCTPNYFGSIVAEISQKKSPIFRAMITDPMLPILQMAREEHKQKLEEYEADLAEWKAKKDNRGAEPIKPRPRVYSFSKATGESIPYQVQQFPLQSLLWTCDELAGLLKSGNQYRGGKGSDEEDLLEYWNGGSTGVRVLRSDGMRTDLDRLSLSIFGTIQPSVLAEFLGRGDNNGKFARFDFVLQPLAACELDIDMPTVDLSPMLTALYSKIDRLPPINFSLSLEARRRFIAFYNTCENRRIKESDPAIAGMIGKSPEKVGKLLTCIHAIHSLFDGDEISHTIETEAVLAAIKFVQFAEAQIRSIRTEIGDRHELAPNLARMIQTIARKGIATVRDVVNGFSSKNRPSFTLAKTWLQELLSLGYVVTVSEGKFTVTEKCGYSGYNLSNSYSESDTAVATSGYESPNLATSNKNQSPESPAVARLVASGTYVEKGLQPESPESPEKNQNRKNANAEIAESVTVGTSPLNIEADVPNPIATFKQERIAYLRERFKPTTQEKILEGRGMAGFLNYLNGVKPKGFKVTEALALDILSAFPVSDPLREVREGDVLITQKGMRVARIEKITNNHRIYLKPLCDQPLNIGTLKDGFWQSSLKEYKEWKECGKFRADSPVEDEPNWQPGQKLKLRIPGQMQGDVVEFIGFKWTPEGVAKAIVNWLGKQQLVDINKLSEAT